MVEYAALKMSTSIACLLAAAAAARTTAMDCYAARRVTAATLQDRFAVHVVNLHSQFQKLIEILDQIYFRKLSGGDV